MIKDYKYYDFVSLLLPSRYRPITVSWPSYYRPVTVFVSSWSMMTFHRLYFILVHHLSKLLPSITIFLLQSPFIVVFHRYWPFKSFLLKKTQFLKYIKKKKNIDASILFLNKLWMKRNPKVTMMDRESRLLETVIGRQWDSNDNRKKS